MSTRKLEQIKDQARRLLSEEGYLTATQLASLSSPPVSSASMAIALNQLFSEGEVRHSPGNGWTLVHSGGEGDAVEA